MGPDKNVARVLNLELDTRGEATCTQVRREIMSPRPLWAVFASLEASLLGKETLVRVHERIVH